jgi:hypothetical protein
MMARFARCYALVFAAGYAALVLAQATLSTVSSFSAPFAHLGPHAVVAAAHGLVVTALAAGSWRRGRTLWLWLTAIAFIIQTPMAQVELALFAQFFETITPAAMISAAIVASLCAAVQAGAAAFALSNTPAPTRPAFRWSRSALAWAWRMPLAIVLYVVAYITAGSVLAWSNPELREFYDQGASINVEMMMGFQVVRGAAWALLAAFVIRGLTVSYWPRALLSGAALSVFFCAQLVYATDAFPETVRLSHLIETSISNFVYGVIAAVVMNGIARKPTP